MQEVKSGHGGNIYEVAKQLGIKESEILDYSANISPLGIPEEIREALKNAIDGTINYPDPDCSVLSEKIAQNDHVLPSYVLCGNGGADLLFRLATGLKPKKALLPVPAFIEYEEALKTAETKMIYYEMEKDFTIKEDILEYMTPDLDLVILCNPNNPTGILLERELVRKIVKKAKQNGAMVLLDECFLEIYSGEEAYTMKGELKDFDNLIILKSFTKMYAIPGVRLGYVLCSNPEIIMKMKAAGQAWSVSHLAQAAGVTALTLTQYKQNVIDYVKKENEYMREEMRKLPITLYEGAVNYLFFCTNGDTTLDERMKKHGIMIRNCSNYKNTGNDYFRVAVKVRQENDRLLKALREEL